jgi:hypothetical protein
MNRKGLILLLLSFAWPITCLHVLWAGQTTEVHWFLNDQWDFIQQYFYFLFDKISYVLIFWAIWLYINSNMRKDRDILLMFGALFVNQLIDLPHYIAIRQSSELVTCMQGIIILYAAGRVLYNQILKR